MAINFFILVLNFACRRDFLCCTTLTCFRSQPNEANDYRSALPISATIGSLF